MSNKKISDYSPLSIVIFIIIFLIGLIFICNLCYNLFTHNTSRF